MIFMMALMSLAISLTTMLITHPIALVATIVIQTLIVCMISMLINSTPWFPFIIFLIFLGGVMVLFIYISSLASNENFFINVKSASPATIMMLTLTIYIATSSMNGTNMGLNNNLDTFILKTYSEQLFTTMLLTMIYLLFTLLVVAEIIKLYQAPLRSSWYDNYS